MAVSSTASAPSPLLSQEIWSIAAARARFRADVFVDAGPVSTVRMQAALDAGFKRVLSLAPSAAQKAEIAAAFAQEVEHGLISPITAARPDALSHLLRDEGARCLIWLSPAEAPGESGPVSPAGFERLLTMIQAIGRAKRDDHALLVAGVRRLKQLPADRAASGGASLDAVIAEVRGLNPDYRVGFVPDETGAALNVAAFSVGVVETDDVETLSAVLSSPEALVAAAMSALERRGVPLTELPNHLPHHHARLSEIALAGGQGHVALSYGLRAAVIAPQSVGYHLMVCEAAQATGRLATLAESAGLAIALAPENPHAHRYQSIAYERAGERAKAIEAADLALALAGPGPDSGLFAEQRETLSSDAPTSPGQTSPAPQTATHPFDLDAFARDAASMGPDAAHTPPAPVVARALSTARRSLMRLARPPAGESAAEAGAATITPPPGAPTPMKLGPKRAAPSSAGSKSAAAPDPRPDPAAPLDDQAIAAAIRDLGRSLDFDLQREMDGPELD